MPANIRRSREQNKFYLLCRGATVYVDTKWPNIIRSPVQCKFISEGQSQQIMRYKFEITIKEVGRETPIKTSYIGDVNYQFLVEFFGLNNPDGNVCSNKVLQDGSRPQACSLIGNSM